MSDIILHHYPGSPFAEKIRVLLGSRKLAWRSVIIPAVMPKPDVVALTGGYRRTPILQIGSDIYCDTALIAHKLDELSNEPGLFPAENRLSAQAIAAWADAILFRIAVTLVFQPAVIKHRFASEEEAKTFVADRMALSKNGSQRKITLVEATAVFQSVLEDYEAQLGDGRDFLFGASPTIADFALYHPFWFVRNAAIISEKFAPFPKVTAWMDRIAGFGHGQFTDLSSADALAIARDSRSVVKETTSNIADLEVGAQVQVAPADYGMDPVVGELLLANDREVVIRRRDERAGEVAVHFPRFCYSISSI